MRKIVDRTKLEELYMEVQEAVVDANKAYKQLSKARDHLEELIINLTLREAKKKKKKTKAPLLSKK